jgi:hypothetical protein
LCGPFPTNPGANGGWAIGANPAGGFFATARNNQQTPGWCTPYPYANPAYPAIRSGGGGGGGSMTAPSVFQSLGGGGGGGGGRGNAGNAGGAGGAGGTGTAGTPATFNCVPVSPGTTTPITVASPGGQIVISWNPQ